MSTPSMTQACYAVAFIGLGVMGQPMARHLAAQGHRVTVYNRTRAKAIHWLSQVKASLPAAQIQVADTPAAAAVNADFVFTCVGNDEDLRQVILGEQGVFQTMKADSVLIDHTTASATIARELYQQALQRGLHSLDAPVSGGQSGAEKGILTVMVGGDEAIFQRATPVIQAYARAVTHLGAAGNGQLTKMVNQLCIVGLLQSLSEAINFGLHANLDMHKVLDVISKGAATSWQLENRGHTMVDDQFNFGFAVDLLRKDLGLCFAEARQNGALLPVTALIDQFYAELQAMGGNRWDTSSLIKRLRRETSSL